MFARLIKNLCETGSIYPRKRNRRKTRTDEASEVAALVAVANNPHRSTRQIESYSDISKTSVLSECLLMSLTLRKSLFTKYK
jgi:hypothetical protein